MQSSLTLKNTTSVMDEDVKSSHQVRRGARIPVQLGIEAAMRGLR